MFVRIGLSALNKPKCWNLVDRTNLRFVAFERVGSSPTLGITKKKEYSLIGKTSDSKLDIVRSSRTALDFLFFNLLGKYADVMKLVNMFTLGVKS